MTSVPALRVVLITGGSAGLGKELALAFGRQPQTQIVICGRDTDRLDAAVRELRGRGLQIEGVVADVTSQEDVRRLFAQITTKFGRLDVLVNNAGQSTRGKAIETSPQDFQALWEINFLAAVRTTQTAYPLLKQSRGSIVFIGSLASKMASPFLGAYPATKFPLAAYAQQLRLELADDGLHVLLVCPGPIRREDAGERYTNQSADLPASASKPGGGVKLRGLDPGVLARSIVKACDRRQLELIVPWKARLLIAIAALFSAWGDSLIKRYTRG